VFLLEYAVLAGILYGLYFSLIGIGLNLTFGVLKIVNLAHGDFLMLGGFLAYFLYSALGLSPLWAVPINLVLFVALGGLLYALLIPRLRQSRDPEMASFILFFGLSQAIEALAILAFGNNQRSLPAAAIGPGTISLFGQVFPLSWAAAGAAGLLSVLLLYLYLYHTRLGQATRAVMASREEAVASGLSVGRISALAFGIGLALAAIAGVFAPYLLGGISPNMGVAVTTTSFTVIVIGALGNPVGTVVGGLIYGLALMLMETYASSWATLLPYLLLVITLLIWPSGLLGRRLRSA
jgi:branched-chain amino acid transport system permease protein